MAFLDDVGAYALPSAEIVAGAALTYVTAGSAAPVGGALISSGTGGIIRNIEGSPGAAPGETRQQAIDRILNAAVDLQHIVAIPEYDAKGTELLLNYKRVALLGGVENGHPDRATSLKDSHDLDWLIRANGPWPAFGKTLLYRGAWTYLAWLHLNNRIVDAQWTTEAALTKIVQTAKHDNFSDTSSAVSASSNGYGGVVKEGLIQGSGRAEAAGLNQSLDSIKQGELNAVGLGDGTPGGAKFAYDENGNVTRVFVPTSVFTTPKGNRTVVAKPGPTASIADVAAPPLALPNPVAPVRVNTPVATTPKNPLSIKTVR